MMEKPFDTKVLGDKLKEAIGPIGETAAEQVSKIVFAWVTESAIIHPNPVVKALVPAVVATVEPLLQAQIDKIDGQPG